MTCSSSRRLLPLLLWLAVAPAWAGLGDGESSIEGERAHLQARHAVARTAHYAVHELTLADGSRLRQYVAGHGRVFAVRWSTFFKPDMASLLGDSFVGYSDAAHLAAQRGGLQRQFHHEGADLVLQSSGHMNVYRGFAYRPSLVPRGLNLQSMDLG